VSDRAVLDLARAAGIGVDWVDAAGRPQRVGLDSLRGVLTALGYPAATATEISESGHRLQSAGASATLPPLITQQVGARLVLPHGSVDGEAQGELAYEDGATISLRLRARAKGVVGPVLDRVGYHRLRLAGREVTREVTVAVAPARCVTVEQRGAGRRMWGVAAQLYGLRRPGDGGIGDATAVRELAEAAAQHGADAVALSPVHSLFAADPGRYGPYSPSSRLFLNPLFADPAIVFGEARVAPHRSDTVAFERVPLVQWQQAGAAKLAWLRRLFDDFETHDVATATPLAAEFARFVADSGDLLLGHALFEALHARWPGDRSPRSDWRDWPHGFREGARHAGHPAVAEFLATEGATVRFHQFLQWLAARSFEVAHAAAVGAGMRIGLIGDLAIGMDRAGSHAWSRQADLLLGLAIGAPPDDFNRHGQDWGLAGFSPHALVAGGFEPFLSTLRAAMRHTGGVRIDHVMGLQRLWLIPEGATPSEGAYLAYPFDDLLRLTALESQRHGAVVIGEDLGTVPAGFRSRLRRAGIAGMDVLWFERTRAAFRTPARWRRDAVAMTTTHDLPTVAGWWSGADIDLRRDLGLGDGGSEDGPDRAREEKHGRHKDRRHLWRAFAQAGIVGEAPPPSPDDPEPAVDAALAFVAASPAPLMLAPLEDLLGVAQQPNLPGTIERHPNWRRRLDPPAASLFEAPQVARRAGLIARQRMKHRA
jgi:4-alpha-glucanotransferase